MRGSLNSDFLLESIHTISDSRDTGFLSLSRDTISKRIYFGEGTMIFANFSYCADRLGEFLVGTRR